MDKTFAQTGMDKSIPHIGVIMDKTDTADYPRYDLPPGYTFAFYKPGLERMWIEQKVAVGEFDDTDGAETVFKREFLYGQPIDWLNFKCDKLDPDEIQSAPLYYELCKRMLFILDEDGKLAATGAIWHGEHFGETRQRLHWISVAPRHQNKGLSKPLMTKLMDMYVELGFSGYIYLTSQTWSYKALNIYAHFGFKPYMGEKPQNYAEVDLETGKPWDYKAMNEEAWTIINDKINQYSKCRR